MTESLPLMYTELADWWLFISHPDEYVEEAGIFARTILEFFPEQVSSGERLTMLELGSGGGNNASHLKAHFDNTLVDLSPEMIRQSRKINPELTHHQGDMRTVRLGQTFDVVFVHDAVDYLTSLDDLRQMLATARAHLRPGGLALIDPDFTRETFQPSRSAFGRDEGDSALSYLEWTYDPDPTDSTYIVDFAYLLREGPSDVRCIYDRHIVGLFSRADWLRLMEEAGFAADTRPFIHSEVAWQTEMFVGVAR